MVMFRTDLSLLLALCHAFLCHLLKDTDYHAPQTWCAVGNAFSLAREHDQAIAAFKRATQIDDSFAYAWTLMVTSTSRTRITPS